MLYQRRYGSDKIFSLEYVQGHNKVTVTYFWYVTHLFPQDVSIHHVFLHWFGLWLERTEGMLSCYILYVIFLTHSNLFQSLMATPGGQKFIRTPSRKTCLHHKGKQLEWYCETCPALICTKCISTNHKSHTFTELSDFTPKIKQKILDYVNKTEKNQLVDILRQITSTKDIKNKNVSQFQTLSSELIDHGERLKHDIDILIAESLSLYQQLEVDNNELLDTHTKYLEEKFQDLKDQ